MRFQFISLCILGVGLGTGLAGWKLSRVGIYQGYSPVQPIAFSHKVHAGENRIPCLYCHFGARKGRHAGIPPDSVCMNCHSIVTTQTSEIEKLKEAVLQHRPIVWVKVHNLPDFVYFNHSQHVLSGVTCQSCHGPIESMERVTQALPLTMGWCLECHRANAGIPTSGFERAVLSLRQRHKPVPGLDCGKCHY
jgi:hypothetical protein